MLPPSLYIPLLALCLLLSEPSTAAPYTSNFTQEFYLAGLLGDGSRATQRKEGTSQGVFRGRGMLLNVRIRASGTYAYTAGESGLGMFYRQYVDGNPGAWVETAQLKPDDLPDSPNSLDAEGSQSFYAGIYQVTTSDAERKAIIGGRTGMRMEGHKFAIGGNPESKAFVMVSAFGHSYTSENNRNGYAELGQAYVFTGEFYHWTQVCIQCSTAFSLCLIIFLIVCILFFRPQPSSFRILLRTQDIILAAPLASTSKLWTQRRFHAQDATRVILRLDGLMGGTLVVRAAEQCTSIKAVRHRLSQSGLLLRSCGPVIICGITLQVGLCRWTVTL